MLSDTGGEVVWEEGGGAGSPWERQAPQGTVMLGALKVSGVEFPSTSSYSFPPWK